MLTIAPGAKVFLAADWERGGFGVYYKRLARGKFRLPRIAPDVDRVVLTGPSSRCCSAVST